MLHPETLKRATAQILRLAEDDEVPSTLIVTSAPDDYDYGYTTTVWRSAPSGYGGEVRIVACAARCAVYQIGRYQSGLHLAATLSEFIAPA